MILIFVDGSLMFCYVLFVVVDRMEPENKPR